MKITLYNSTASPTFESTQITADGKSISFAHNKAIKTIRMNDEGLWVCDNISYNRIEISL